MDRRQFLKQSSLFVFAGWLLPSLVLDASAEVVHPPMDLLNGVIPEGASPAVSSLFKFRHHHYVYVPAEILAAPPAEGFKTKTSMIVSALGVAQPLIDQKRHFHYHAMAFTRDQLESIARGNRTVVDILLAGKLNHRFVFNDADTFAEQTAAIAEDAKDRGFPRKLKGPIVPLYVE